MNTSDFNAGGKPVMDPMHTEADPGLFLGGGALLTNDLTDW